MLLEVEEADEGGDERLVDMVMSRKGGEEKGSLGGRWKERGAVEFQCFLRSKQT